MRQPGPTTLVDPKGLHFFQPCLGTGVCNWGDPNLGGGGGGCTVDGISGPCSTLGQNANLACPGNVCSGFNSHGSWVNYTGIAGSDVGFYGCVSAGTYSSATGAAAAAGACSNPASLVSNSEWSGNTYQTANGQYSFTLPEEGTLDSSPFDPTAIPADTTYAGAYHTHGGDTPGYWNEIFSSEDILLYSRYSASNGGVNTPGFLITPSGRFEVFYPNAFITNPRGCVLSGSPVPAGFYGPPPTPPVRNC